jgi:hypothetical protein
MNLWSAVGIFLLGSGTGALTTVALHSSQIGELRRRLEAGSRYPLLERQSPEGEDVQRKSA